MTGSKTGAEAGTLLFIVGGDEEVVEKLKPLYAAMGKKIFRMGETGKGQSAKLVMNLQIALIYEGFAEALALAAKLGVDSGEAGASDQRIDGQVRSGGIQGAICSAPRFFS